MSDYEDRESSPTGSAPVEAYKFIGSFRNYLYTSANKVIRLPTGLNGKVESYTPIAVNRSRVKAGTQEDDNLSLDLGLPFDIDVVRDYAYAQTPPKLQLEVYRKQQDSVSQDGYALFWKGLVRGFSVTGRSASVSVPSIFSLALQGEIPNVFYQAPCNKVLYDARCKVPRAAHTITRTIQGVSGTTVLLTAAAGGAASLYAAGEIVSERNGERRMVLDNAGDQIDIGYAFVDLKAGDTVQISKGCDHSLGPACKDKFDNVINFGGFNYIPLDNPFEGTL
jgi:uncharacterized phage protein (TIGR02218 family)